VEGGDRPWTPGPFRLPWQPSEESRGIAHITAGQHSQGGGLLKSTHQGSPREKYRKSVCGAQVDSERIAACRGRLGWLPPSFLRQQEI